MPQRHHDQALWREQRRKSCHPGFSFRMIKVHPHRKEHEEVKAHVASAHYLQRRKGVINPIDTEPLMQHDCSFAQSAGGLNCHDAVPLPCEPRRIGARAGSNVQDSARTAPKEMHLGAVFLLK